MQQQQIKKVKKNKRRQNNDGRIVLVNHLQPSSIVVPLRYYWANVALTNLGNRTASKQLRVNAPYDIDASLGTTSVNGFTEWSALYTHYRVLKVSARADFVNADAIPTFCAIGFTVTSFTANTWSQSYWQNDFTASSYLGQTTGNDTSSIQLGCKLKALYGDMAVLTDNDFASQVGTVPNALLYFQIGADSGSNSYTQTNGVLVRVELVIHTEFFGRAALSN